MHADFLRLYVITNSECLRQGSLEEAVEAAVLGGASMIQYREKERPLAERIREAEALQKICKRYQVPFLINDDVELAERIHADGVHLGQSDMAIAEARRILGGEAIIGATAKTVEQAKAAEAAGADYLGSGAVFGSATKLDAKPMELCLLREITEAVKIPVVAIGGINASNVLCLKGCGIAGVAVIGGVLGCDNVMAAAADLRQLVQLLD